MSQLNQYSSIIVLGAGNYDGKFKYSEIMRNNNFGIGTFDQLDGEMIGFDNKFFKIKSDGSVEKLNLQWTTPFASLYEFTKVNKTIVFDKQISKQDLLDDIKTKIDSNKTYAIKMTGSFEEIRTRTVSKQTKPYINLAKAVASQSVQSINNISGTVVGFYTPTRLNKIGVEGFHLHFVNDEFNFGGHIQNFVSKHIIVELSLITDMNYVESDYEIKTLATQDEINIAEK